jgi:hypothetical protein
VRIVGAWFDERSLALHLSPEMADRRSIASHFPRQLLCEGREAWAIEGFFRRFDFRNSQLDANDRRNNAGPGNNISTSHSHH